MIIASILILIVILVAVRLFDSSIRDSKYGKEIVVWLFLSDIAFLIISIISYVIGG